MSGRRRRGGEKGSNEWMKEEVGRREVMSG